MGRYWRIYSAFLKSSFARDLEFRVNFLAKIAHNLIWTLFFVVILLVIYAKTPMLAGWSQGASYVLAGTIFILDAFTRGLFFSLTEIPESVRKGTLDFVVTKPVDSQFWVSTRRFNFEQLGVLLGGLAMIVVGIGMAELPVTALGLLSYIALTICAILIFYAFNLAMMTLGIWLVRVDNLWVLADSIVQVARYPIDIFGFGVQRFLLFVIPLGFLATIPARQLKDGFDPAMLGLGLLWTAVLMIGARQFWKFALRSYGSASS